MEIFGSCIFVYIHNIIRMPNLSFFFCLQLSYQLKVGIMYCKSGQSTEEEMYNNESAGPAFEEFLQLLGERVRLKGFEKYRAQLDTKSKASSFIRFADRLILSIYIYLFIICISHLSLHLCSLWGYCSYNAFHQFVYISYWLMNPFFSIIVKPNIFQCPGKEAEFSTTIHFK